MDRRSDALQWRRRGDDDDDDRDTARVNLNLLGLTDIRRRATDVSVNRRSVRAGGGGGGFTMFAL